MPGRVFLMITLIALVPLVANAAFADTTLDNCEKIRGQDGALAERMQMEGALNRNLEAHYRKFCQGNQSLTLSYPEHLYRSYKKKNQTGKNLARIAAPTILVSSAVIGGIFWGLSVNAQQTAEDGEWFAGLGEIMMAITFWTVGGVIGVAALIAGAVVMVRTNRKLKRIQTYQRTRGSSEKRFDISMQGAAFTVRF
ncbi:MAG: hypothetical protein JXX29_10150 [Deltaproteobacteria bacterium]|nr:hypothetical protein [Deltaproteobacteria bacterium]MBN2672027.1 hypothetical protein [Deltaproteobacteria bacterium]